MDQPQHCKSNSHDQQNKVSTVTFHQCYTPKIGPLQARVKNGSFSKLKGLVILKATAGHVCLVFLFIFKYQIPQRSSRQTEVINLGCRISSRDLYYFECLRNLLSRWCLWYSKRSLDTHLNWLMSEVHFGTFTPTPSDTTQANFVPPNDIWVYMVGSQLFLHIIDASSSSIRPEINLFSLYAKSYAAPITKSEIRNRPGPARKLYKGLDLDHSSLQEEDLYENENENKNEGRIDQLIMLNGKLKKCYATL